MYSTLVLDPAYRPHKVVPWQRAVTLLFAGRVEVVEEYDAEIRSVSVVLRVPAVVRLVGKLRKSKVAIRFSRQNILTRDKFTCQYCGQKKPQSKLNYDHVIPRSHGGKTNWENVVASCYPCNDRKANRTPQQAGMRLLTAPKKPDFLPLHVLRFAPGVSLPDKWASYVYWTGPLDEEL